MQASLPPSPYGPPMPGPTPYYAPMPPPRPRMPTGLLIALVLAVASIVATAGIFAYVFLGRSLAGVPTATISGHVLAGGAAMVPVSNAVVTMTASSGTSDRTVSDASGGYSLAAVPGVSYTLWATLGTHWGSATSLLAYVTSGSAGTVSQDLLVPASDISGAVLSRATGAAIRGATMSLAEPAGDWWCCQITGLDGRYRLWAITAGTYNVSVSASGYPTAFALISVPSMFTSETWDFVLPQTNPGVVTIFGHVLAGANVSVPVSGAGISMGENGIATQETVTNLTGGFRFTTAPGTLVSFWTSLGTYWGSAYGSSPILILSPNASIVYVNVSVPASDISGVVTNATTGLPIAGATLSIADPSGSRWCCQYTNSDGRYLLWVISTGSFNVSAAALGYTTLSATVSVPSIYVSESQDFPLK